MTEHDLVIEAQPSRVQRMLGFKSRETKTSPDHEDSSNNNVSTEHILAKKRTSLNREPPRNGPAKQAAFSSQQVNL